MAVVNIRGYHIKLHAKEGRQLQFAVRQMEQRSNTLLAEYEREFFPNRAILREALDHIDAAEQKLRSLLYDLIEAAEQEAAKDPDFIPDYVNDEGDELLFPETVAPVLDGVIHSLWEQWMTLKEELDNPEEVL